jgi:hypothetical protein
LNIGVVVHKESISIGVSNDARNIVMECVIETKANTIPYAFPGSDVI